MSERFTSEQLSPADLPPCEYVLGAEAVKFANLACEPEAQAQYNFDLNIEVLEQITAVRANLQQYRSGDLFMQAAGRALSAHMYGLKEGVPAFFGNRDKLRNDPLGWLEDMSDETLLNFMQWNEYDHRSAQNELRQQLHKVVNQMSLRIGELVETSGWPTRVPQLLESAQDTVTAYVSDPFNYIMARHQLMAGGAYYSANKHHMVVSRGETMLDGRVNKKVTHEMMHVVSFEDDETSLLMLFGSDPKVRTTWLDEAANEHCTQAVLAGNPEIIDPSERRDSFGTYAYERMLLGAICECGDIQIPAKDIIAAKFERDSDHPLRKRLCDNVEKSLARYFPELEGNILLTITKEYNEAPMRLKEDVMSKWFMLIYERTGRGNVGEILNENVAPDITRPLRETV